VIRIAARLLSALFVASLISPALGVAPVAASGNTDHFDVSGLPVNVTAGDQRTITVEARDNTDTLDSTFAGTISFSSSDGNAILPSGGQSLTSGSGTFQVTFETAGPQTVTVTQDGDTPHGSQGTTVDPAAADHFNVSGFNDPTTAGDAHDFNVEAADQFGNTDTNYSGTVHFTSSDGQAGLPADDTLTNGLGTFSATLKTSGNQSITAHDGGVTGSQANITVHPAAADHIVLSAYPATTQSGDAHTLSVTAKDPYGNVDTNDTDTATVTTTDPADHVSPGSHPLVNGTWDFDVTFNTVGTWDISASASSFNDGQNGITVDPGAATHFVVDGFGPTVTAGDSDVVTVTAKDAADNVVTDYTGTVHITTTSANKVLPADHTFTLGESGVHMFVVTLNTAGTQSITATDTGDASVHGTQSGITVDPAAATDITVSGYPSPTVAGVAHNVTVTAVDQFGNTETNYAGTVTFSSSDGSAVLPVDSTLTNGTGSFSVTLKSVGGGRSITATDTVDSSLSGTQGSINVTPSAATHFVVTGFNSPQTAGVGDSFVVTAKDAFNNTATGYAGTVHLTSSDGQAVLGPNATLTSGVGNFNATLKTAGLQSITATDTVNLSITGSQTNITINPASATHLGVTGFDNPATAGVGSTYTVTALDAFDNTATAYGGTVHFTINDPAVTAPTNSTLTNGVGTFPLTLKTAGSRTLTATDTLQGTITGQQTVNVVAGPAVDYLVTGFGPATAGSSDSFTVTARDQFGNTATGYSGTVHFSSSDGGATLPSVSSLTNGFGSFNATLTHAGTSESITATDSVDSSITGTDSPITVIAASATHFTVSGFNNPTTAGTSDGFAVIALDQFNNVATGYAGTIHFSSSDPSASLPATTTLPGGSGGFNATLKTVGTRSISVNDVGTPSINGSQGGIVVVPGAADHLGVSGPLSATAGVLYGFSVTVFDAEGNQVTGYTGTLTFTSSDLSATLPGDHTFTTGGGGDNGTASFSATLKTAGTRSITATDTVSSSVTGTQGGIVVSAAAADHLTVSYPSPTGSNVAHGLTVTAKDTFGNTDTGYTGTVTFSSSDGQAVLPADYTFLAGDHGVKTLSATLKTQGVQSITATDTVTSSITGTRSSIAVAPGSPDHVVISPTTPTTTAGSPVTFAIEGFDAADNDLGDFTGFATFTIDGSPCTGTSCGAVAVGPHTVVGTDNTDSLSDTTTLTITNTAPVAHDDTLTVLEDAAATPLSVLTNDTDVNGDSLTVTGTSQGTHGSVTTNGTTVSYTPDADWNGSDSFTYDISDGHGGTATATVNVTITAVNDAPTFTIPASAPTIAEQSGVSPQTVAGFATGIAPGPPTATDESGQTLTLTSVSSLPGLFSAQPAIDKTTGDLTYTPAVNRNGTATITVTLKDDGGTANGGVDTTVHSFTITITGIDHPPVALNDIATVVAGSPATAINVLANDNANNLDQGEVLKIASVTQGSSGGTVTITGGGTGLTYKPKAGFIGTDFFTYKVKDASHTSGPATVLVHVPKDTFAPTTTAPVQSVATGGVLGTSTVVMRLTWTGSDLGAGISRFELWQSVDGHGYTRISVTSSRSALVNVAIAHRYRFRVRGIDLIGNVGAMAYGVTFTPHLTQESGASFSPGQWYLSNSTSYSGGHERRTSIMTADASFTTTTRSFSWVGARGPNRGTADVYIDGTLVAHVNTNATTYVYRFVIFTYNFATTGVHTIRIVYTGSASKSVDVDAFVSQT
jgi:hypothetical protein